MKKMTYPMFYAGEKQNYAAAVVAGDLVFCSGMSGRLPDSGWVRSPCIGVQAWDALDKIKHNLEGAGTSDPVIEVVKYCRACELACPVAGWPRVGPSSY